MESECGFLLFTRTKSGVTMTAAAESLLRQAGVKILEINTE